MLDFAFEKPRAAPSVSVAICLAVALLTGQTLRADRPAPPGNLRPCCDDLQKDGSGWTELSPETSSRVVYVSTSTGSDDNSGLVESSPIASLSRARTLARDGHPDWIRLKRGDRWDEPFPGWYKSGESSSNRMVITSYGPGENRPLIAVPEASQTALALTGNRTIENLAIVGIHFQAPIDGSGRAGISMAIGDGGKLLIEDCQVEGFKDGIILQGGSSPYGGGPLRQVTIRRSIVKNSAAPFGGHSQGIYASNVAGLVIEECLILHNGWNSDGSAPATIFNHNLYLQSNNSDCRVSRNLIVSGSSHGLQIRSGGIVEDNVFVKNPIAILFGGGDKPTEAGVSGRVAGNVILQATTIDGSPRGWGIDIQNVNSAGVVVENNILANDLNPSNQFTIRLKADSWGSGIGIRRFAARNNTSYRWNGGIIITKPSAEQLLENVRFESNVAQEPSFTPRLVDVIPVDPLGDQIVFDGNTYHSLSADGQWFRLAYAGQTWENWGNVSGETNATANELAFFDPERDLASYNESIGRARSEDDFLEQAALQSKERWRTRYTASSVLDYLRAGFRHE